MSAVDEGDRHVVGPLREQFGVVGDVAFFPGLPELRADSLHNGPRVHAEMASRTGEQED